MKRHFDALKWADRYNLAPGQLIEYEKRYKDIRTRYENGEKVNIQEAEFLEDILSKNNFLSARFDYNRKFTKEYG